MIGFDDRGAIRKVYERRNLPLEPKTVLSIMARKSRIMMDLIHRRQFQRCRASRSSSALWRHVPLGICSGGLREEIETMLEGVSLRDCFPVIVAAEDVTIGKPDPMGYLLTATLLAEKTKKPLNPADCLVVEDARR